jgi:hypothetical protein
MKLTTQNNWGNEELLARGLETVRFEKLNSGGMMMVPVLAEFSDDEWAIELVLDVVDGEVSCVRYAVGRSDGEPLQFFNTEIANGHNLKKLMAQAVEVHALEETGDGKYRYATTEIAREAVIGSVRRTRTSVTQELLEEIVEAYKTRDKKIKMDEFAQSLGYGKRRMNDLLNEAEQRGLMPPRSNRRKP